MIASDLKHLSAIQQAALIHAAEAGLAEASAWAFKAEHASDRLRMRAIITRQKKLVWQAKHGR